MDKKPISFGFSKISKRPDKKPELYKKIELIDCLEGKSIKIKDAVEEVKELLVIPVKESSKNLINRIKENRQKAVKIEIKQEEKPDLELTLDELAARELIKEAQNRDKLQTTTTKIQTLPLNENERFVAEGESEPTLEDYENIPIADYGMAMLRGMGWKEGMAIGRDPTKTVPVVDPELRPKGLGLGADKLITMDKPGKVVDKDGKELMLIKGAYCKIIAGKHKGHYCQIQGLDDQSGRIIVEAALTNEILSLDEFLLTPVTKDEYTLGSKVINNVKYEQYKEIAEERLNNYREKIGANNVKNESSSDSAVNSDICKSKSVKNKKHKSRRDRDRSREQSLDRSYKKNKKKKSKSRYRSSSRDSDDGYYKHRHDRRKR